MTKKEVIYIDSEDDITSVIDKSSSSSADIIALVLPKRYATLKSSVNMKLLKRIADDKKKKIVLITKDEVLRALAGSAEIYVAESLKSHPVIPRIDKPDVLQGNVIEEIDPSIELNKSIGKPEGDKQPKTGDLPIHSGSTKASDNSEKIKKIKSSSKIKVPNFNKFRLKLILSVLLVVGLIVGWFVAFKVLPTANITIKAQTSRVVTEVTFTIDPKLKTDNIAKNLVAGEVQEISKTVTERFKATGEKDVGAKASGLMTISNCDSSSSFTLPAGTIFTDDTSGFEYTSQAEISVPGASFSGGICSTAGTADIAVSAVDSGDTRNLAPRNYSVVGMSNLITGFGGNMTGGISKIVTVVSDNDIKLAKKLLLAKTDANVRVELAALFPVDTVVVGGTFATTNTTAVSSVKAGVEASEAKVSAQFTYSVIGVSKETMSALLGQQQKTLVDTENQAILDNGFSTVKVLINKKLDGGKYKVDANTIGFVGPEINVQELAKQIAGKRFSAAVDFIKAKPGVREVDIGLSPFWVFSLPKAEKIAITIDVSDSTLQ